MLGTAPQIVFYKIHRAIVKFLCYTFLVMTRFCAQKIYIYDPLAQLGERLGDNQEVIGSSPIRVTSDAAAEMINSNYLSSPRFFIY